MSFTSWFDTRITTICNDLIRVRGVTALCGLNDVPYKQFKSIPYYAAEGSDPDTFLTVTPPMTLVIPTGLAGRYLIHCKVFWLKNTGDQPQLEWTVDNAHAGMLWLFLRKSSQPDESLSGSRTTSTVVPHATHTSQQIIWEGNLENDESIELHARQSVIDEEYVPGPEPIFTHRVMVELQGILIIRRLGMRT